ncbi:molecular chaperone GrpE [Cytobacillus solani]|uniref:hypothetical protein n=1 Tax=Cytobacillus solani TaxID=1637975 RepID=UPI0006FFB2CE|nr:hypothetical protein [Cytobacillus solani]USK57317.1 molecular chaperone GrpE [Cytobacillus solani]
MKYIYQKNAKLVGHIEEKVLCLLNSKDDWIHDQYRESFIIHGTIYSSNMPFHPQSISITGYFQDEETGKWIKVKNGVAILNSEDPSISWKMSFEELVSIHFKTGKYIKLKHPINPNLKRKQNFN